MNESITYVIIFVFSLKLSILSSLCEFYFTQPYLMSCFDFLYNSTITSKQYIFYNFTCTINQVAELRQLPSNNKEPWIIS